MKYELTDVTIYNDLMKDLGDMEETAAKIFNASNKVKKDIFFKEMVSGLTALILYLLMLLPFADEYLRRGTTVFKILVFLVVPAVFVFASAKISSRNLRRRRFIIINELSGGKSDELAEMFEVAIFMQDMGRGRVWITDVKNGMLKYDFEINNKIEHRFVKCSRVNVKWGAEKTSIHFYNNGIELELMGEEH